MNNFHNIVKIDANDIRYIVENVIKKVYPNNNNGKPIRRLDVEKIFHLSQIPKEKLHQAYKDFYLISSVSTFGGPFESQDGKIIKEEATYTMSLDETKKIIQQKFSLQDWQICSQVGANRIELMLIIPDIARNVEAIKDAMAACGWSYAAIGKEDIDGLRWIGLSFDPMFQYNASTEIRQYPTLYHWAPMYRYDIIMKEGLKPRSENSKFHYPDRLHLIKGNVSFNAVMSIGQQLCNANNNPENDGDYILFEIPVNKIPSDIEIYLDPRFEYGCYLKVSISPDVLRKSYRYNFKTGENLPVPR